MKHSKWIALSIYLGLIIICFLPWTYHADVGKYFNGFYSEKGVYGKPGKFIVIFSVICTIMNFIPKIWAKFTHIFFGGLIVAYAIKTYHLYTSSYNAYTPEKQTGIYLLLIFSFMAFAISLLPEMKINKE